MIEIDGLEVVFGAGTVLETHALRGLSLAVPAGQFVTVIGSNGAGKSTLLGALAGDVPAAAGRIVVAGRDVTNLPAHARAGLFARVFQDPLAGSCGELTVAENLALAARRGATRGLARAVGPAAHARFGRALAQLGLGLERRLDDRMGLLSGGQRQAVSLLMGTLAPCKVLLLDEHTAALDPRMGALVLDLTRRLVAEHGLTTLMVTHSMRDALGCGERTIMLHEGRIVFDLGAEERRGLTVADLVALFSSVRGEELADDSLLLG